MKIIITHTYLLLSALFILLFCNGCKKNNNIVEVDNEKGFVETGSCLSINNTEFPVICFDSLVTDCRCPEDVFCVWSGYAQVKLRINTGTGYKSFELSTLGSHWLAPRDTVIDNYRIKLVDVLPHRKAFTQSYEKTTVKLEVTR